MTELTRALYEFTLRRRMGGVWDAPEYANFRYCAELKETQLRARLDSDGQKLLDDLLEELTQQHNVELETVFSSALGIYKELNMIL